jgi:hypothetical protein
MIVLLVQAYSASMATDPDVLRDMKVAHQEGSINA